MNDGTNNSSADTDNGTSIGEDAGTTYDIPEVPEDNTSDDSAIDSVSDTLGSDSLSVTDTESDTGDTESNSVDNTETNVEVQETSTGSTVDYTYELNNIEYWQTQQLAEMQAVQSVSGNSIMVSFDDDSMQALTEIQEKQDMLIDGQGVFCGLLGCLVFAVCADFLIHSAKRIMKNLTGKKE